MKKFTDIYQSSILIIGALSLMVMCWYQRREINTLIDENTKVKFEAEALQGGDILKAQSYDSVLALKDSFYYENFNNENILGRYEVTLEILKEENPKAAEQFEKILSTKTE
jgi:accessory colonization factor AcfC